MFILRKESDKDNVLTYIKSLNLDKPQYVEIDEYKGKRTKAQNAYFHLCCGYISKDTGYTPEEVKAKIVLSIWEPEIKTYKVKGEDVTLMERKSTANLTKEEFTLLVNELMTVSAKINCQLPMPGSYE